MARKNTSGPSGGPISADDWAERHAPSKDSFDYTPDDFDSRGFDLTGLEESDAYVPATDGSADSAEVETVDAAEYAAEHALDGTFDEEDIAEFGVTGFGDGEFDPENTDWDAVEAAFGFDRSDEDPDAEILPTVAVVGRPNVGKSSLVNRIIGRREAVVEDNPGVTRDRVSYRGEWNGRRVWVQDTGGWEPDARGIHAAIARQAEVAMETADVIIVVVDAKVGITETDEIVARTLQRSTTPVVLAANKTDSDAQIADVAELWALGLGEPFQISAQHGRGTADLLDEVWGKLPEVPKATEAHPSGPRRIALVGKPNVGKSSLLNKLTGEQRAVVDDVAGTTVDPVDSLVEIDHQIYRLVDTAGLRKKVHTARGQEYYASLRTKAAIESAEVVVMLIDASQPVSEQDQRVLAMVVESGKALVIAFNKWDLMDEDRRELLDREIDLQLEHLPWVKRINISATTGRGVHRLGPALEEALEAWDQRISTGRLNTWLKAVIAQTPPPMRGGRLPRVLFATQATTRPPVFVLFTTGFLEHGYRRFLERRLREEFGFFGTPVRLSVRVRERRSRR